MVVGGGMCVCVGGVAMLILVVGLQGIVKANISE